MNKSLYLRAAAVLLLLCTALAVLSCSDMVLNDDGTISHKHGTSVTDTREPLTIVPAPETETSVGFDDDPFADAEHRLDVDFLNTGKSDCILIRADDKTILMDTGENDDFPRIQSALAGYGITSIDCLIITHYDNDHIGAAARVLASYPVGTVYMPDYIRSSGLYRKLADQLAAADTDVHRLWGEDVEFDLGCAHLWINATALPGHERGKTMGSDVDNTDAEENNFSLITHLTFGEVSILFCGDAEGDRMNEYMPLWQARGLSTVTLCKIPHHGVSADKGELAALDILRPRFCVVHTDAHTSVTGAMVTKMRALFSAAYYTCDGTVTFSSDGRDWNIGSRGD